MRRHNPIRERRNAPRIQSGPSTLPPPPFRLTCGRDRPPIPASLDRQADQRPPAARPRHLPRGRRHRVRGSSDVQWPPPAQARRLPPVAERGCRRRHGPACRRRAAFPLGARHPRRPDPPPAPRPPPAGRRRGLGWDGPRGRRPDDEAVRHDARRSAGVPAGHDLGEHPRRGSRGCPPGRRSGVPPLWTRAPLRPSSASTTRAPPSRPSPASTALPRARSAGYWTQTAPVPSPPHEPTRPTLCRRRLHPMAAPAPSRSTSPDCLRHTWTPRATKRSGERWAKDGRSA